MNIFISRNFIEFGPLTSSEFQTFVRRGVVIESDFARQENLAEWWPVYALDRHLASVGQELDQISEAVVDAIADEIEAEQAAAVAKKSAARSAKPKVEEKPKVEAKKIAPKKPAPKKSKN